MSKVKQYSAEVDSIVVEGLLNGIKPFAIGIIVTKPKNDSDPKSNKKLRKLKRRKVN